MGCWHSRSASADLGSSGPAVELVPLAPTFGREPPVTNASKPLPAQLQVNDPGGRVAPRVPDGGGDKPPSAVVLFREAFMSDPTPQSAARRVAYEARRDAVFESTLPRPGAPHALFTRVSKADVPRATHTVHVTNPEV